MTATDIKIVLNRLNTFGDEVFGDPNVLKSYFYAISDFAVGARLVICSTLFRSRNVVVSSSVGIVAYIHVM